MLRAAPALPDEALMRRAGAERAAARPTLVLRR